MIHKNSWEKYARPQDSAPSYSWSCVSILPSNHSFFTEKLPTKLAITVWPALELEMLLHNTQLIFYMKKPDKRLNGMQFLHTGNNSKLPIFHYSSSAKKRKAQPSW